MFSDATARFAFLRPGALIRVTGEDALTFLQGQFTQELRGLSEQGCAYGLWLTQKGKVLADSFALRRGETWWLVSLHSPAATIVQRLESYIVADDVQLDDLTSQWAAALVVGGSARGLWEREKVHLPAAQAWGEGGEGMIFRGRQSRAENWIWLYPSDGAVPPWTEDPAFHCISEEEMERHRIADGIPRVPEDVGPADLPNEAGLEQDAISYSKGCYLGQEVMARLKSLGQIRRRLLRLRGEGVAPLPHAALYAPGGERPVGEIRTAAGEAGGYVALAMISLLGLGQARLLALSPGGPPDVTVLDRIE